MTEPVGQPPEPEAAGELGSGEMAAGELGSGEMAARELPAGELGSGEMAAGELPAGESAAGESAAGEMAAGKSGGRQPGGDVPGRGPSRHRGVLWAGVTVAVLFVGALVVAFLGSRVNRDAVPGSQPLASLAVIPAGYLVGTLGGLYASPDGKTWTPARLPAELVSVASDGTTAYVLAGGDLKATTDLHTFRLLASGLSGTVIAAGPDGGVVIAATRSVTRVGARGVVTALPVGPSKPEGLLGLAVSPTKPSTILAGGPVSGLWQTDDDGATWLRLVATPTQSLLVDSTDPQRILVATAGGVLISNHGAPLWHFTDLRLDVHGLAQERAGFFALAADRLIYRSADGVSGWAPVGG